MALLILGTTMILGFLQLMNRVSARHDAIFDGLGREPEPMPIAMFLDEEVSRNKGNWELPQRFDYGASPRQREAPAVCLLNQFLMMPANGYKTLDCP